jgi:hypothetical protein
MISKIIHTKHLLDLNEVKNMLDSVGIDSVILETGPLNLLNTLIISLGSDEKGNERQCTCNFIPMDEEFIEDNSLLQFYYIIPFEVKSENIIELSRFLLECNLLQPIGNFGIKNAKEIYFRYVSMQNKYEPLNAQNILETNMLFEYAIDIYQELIDKVNKGELNVEKALEIINEDIGDD